MFMVGSRYCFFRESDPDPGQLYPDPQPRGLLNSGEENTLIQLVEGWHSQKVNFIHFLPLKRQQNKKRKE